MDIYKELVSLKEKFYNSSNNTKLNLMSNNISCTCSLEEFTKYNIIVFQWAIGWNVKSFSTHIAHQNFLVLQLKRYSLIYATWTAFSKGKIVVTLIRIIKRYIVMLQTKSRSIKVNKVEK